MGEGKMRKKGWLWGEGEEEQNLSTGWKEWKKLAEMLLMHFVHLCGSSSSPLPLKLQLGAIWWLLPKFPFTSCFIHQQRVQQQPVCGCADCTRRWWWWGMEKKRNRSQCSASIHPSPLHSWNCTTALLRNNCYCCWRTSRRTGGIGGKKFWPMPEAWKVAKQGFICEGDRIATPKILPFSIFSLASHKLGVRKCRGKKQPLNHGILSSYILRTFDQLLWMWLIRVVVLVAVGLWLRYNGWKANEIGFYIYTGFTNQF